MGVEHNARQIEKYLETHSGLVGPGARPDQPFGKKHKGSSRVPVSDALDRFIFGNRVAAWYITPEVKAVWKSSARYGDVHFSELLTELYRNPAIIRTWRAEETPEAAREHTAFQKMCRFIADLIRGYAPNLQLQVDVNPRDEPADSPIQVHNRRLARQKRWTAQDGYKRLYGRFQRFEEEHPDMSREAAKELFIQKEEREAAKKHREAVSLRTLERAISFAEKGEVA